MSQMNRRELFEHMGHGLHRDVLAAHAGGGADQPKRWGRAGFFQASRSPGCRRAAPSVDGPKGAIQTVGT